MLSVGRVLHEHARPQDPTVGKESPALVGEGYLRVRYACHVRCLGGSRTWPYSAENEFLEDERWWDNRTHGFRLRVGHLSQDGRRAWAGSELLADAIHSLLHDEDHRSSLGMERLTSNHRAGVDAGCGSLFPFGRHLPGTTQKL